MPKRDQIICKYELVGSFFITLVSVGPSFILVGAIMYNWPPKKINRLYGYRTKRSMNSQEAWDFAQRHSAIELIKWGLITSLLSFLGLSWNINEGLSTTLGIVVIIGITVILLLQTENALKDNFD